MSGFSKPCKLRGVVLEKCSALRDEYRFAKESSFVSVLYKRKTSLFSSLIEYISVVGLQRLWFISHLNGNLGSWSYLSSHPYSSTVSVLSRTKLQAYNWHHDQKSDKGQAKDTMGLQLFDFLDPLFLWWKGLILLDFTFLLCDSMLGASVRYKVDWCSQRWVFCFKTWFETTSPQGLWISASCLFLEKCAGDSQPYLVAPCHLVVIID